MKPTHNQASPPGAKGISCDVAAHGALRVNGDGLRLLRQQLTLPNGKPFPPSFLKHLDDQTVAALAAVLQAVERFDLGDTSFTNWGVLAAPRFLGRSTMVSALHRFGEEGAWGVSPHLIPHRSLHSISGTISQALQVRGPNYGVGGGPDGASEAFLAVAGMLGRERLPGAWLVLTGWQPEPMPNQASAAVTCYAAALALMNAETGRQGMQLRLAPDAAIAGDGPRMGVESLVEVLTETPLTTCRQWALDGGGSVELEQAGLGAKGCPVAERRAG